MTDRSDQSDDVLDEAAGLLDGLRRWMRAPGGERTGDVWERAVGQDSPHIAVECRYCPLCRAMAAARASGGDVEGRLLEAARSLLAAAGDFLDGLERSRPPCTGTGREGPDGDSADIRRAEGS
ncbi:hypothetical protein SAMN04489712_101112 [Thermomonospora echinospora]|uniref:Uncharacterized protein n=1 Tax=Thermomonospora echinospora TaxID=1992 RepID=A0A1H5S9U7_9ACTN|nr:hypothetical protein [Thermomonospora echinospora]SEF46778.1 hypothetical protein SAMN04489712_101112 [Thermomonospora echinospora]